MANQYDISTQGPDALALDEAQLCELCDLVLREQGVERPCVVSVSVVDEDRMREVNAEWRGVDRPTDVISLECERPDDPDLAPGEPCELGDILLAPAYIARQAERFSTTPADETRLLVVHGMLHLLGHDHLDEDEAVAMEALEEGILARAGGDGTLGHVVITRHRTEDEA